MLNFNSSSAKDKEEAGYQKFLLSKAIQQGLHKDAYWKALLHYKDKSSIISDKSFFIANDGNINPESELRYTIQSFFEKEILSPSEHSICKFPARLKWISKKLNIEKSSLPKINCNELNKYKRNIGATKISLSFASENVNNLMSMMGHIFIKISGKKNGKEVNHALSYFADFSTGNPILLAFKALFSRSPGTYLLEPYKKRVAEYNDNQSRSIWEYELELTQDQIDSLVLHIWEMKAISPKYNFIYHNCGSALIYLLFTANSGITSLKASSTDAPIDIIKSLYNNGHIKKINLLPADNYRLKMMSEGLSYPDKSYINRIINSGDIPQNTILSEQKKANLLYIADSVISYKFSKEDITQESYDKAYNSIQKDLRKLPPKNLTYIIKDPLQKSRSSQLLFNYKNQENDNIFGLEFYPVYNGLHNNNAGYFNDFELRLANIDALYYVDQNKFRVNKFDLIKVKNIIPNDILTGGLSGALNISIEKEDFAYDPKKMFFDSGFGVGISKNLPKNYISIYSMINFGYSNFNRYNSFYSAPEVGIILREGSLGKLNAKYVKYFTSQKVKYRNILVLEQSFFLLNDRYILLSFERNDTEKEGIVNTLSAKYIYSF